MKNWAWKRVSEIRDWKRKRIFGAKNWIWNHRIWLALLAILLLQAPFVIVKMTIVDATERDLVIPFVETGQILLSSALVVYLVSKKFDSLLEIWLYGTFRRGWKEVRVMYSENMMGKGLGEEYPRDPTLLIQAPVFDDSKFGSYQTLRENILWVPKSKEEGQYMTSVQMKGPMLVSFNAGQLRHQLDNEGIHVTGKWSDLQLMQVGIGTKFTKVGFPDTLIESMEPPAPDRD